MANVELYTAADSSVNEALSAWEKGVLKEKDGSMSDAIIYYRKAIKLRDDVEKIYRKKLHDEWELLKRVEAMNLNDAELDETYLGVADTDEDTTANEPREILPCWILEMLPNDILLRIIKFVILASGESWVNLSLSCSTFNKLCFHNSFPYEIFKGYIYPKQRYDERAMALNGISNLETLERELWDTDYISMLRDRPYIKFEGVYISVVNYLRYGTLAEGSSSLVRPVHMITYYRYFRFYPNGDVLRLLTTDEPVHVVKKFSRDSKPRDSDICHWSLGFDDNFGRLTVTRTTQKYVFNETLAVSKHGNKPHQRLKWICSTVEDSEGAISDCSISNEKPFTFSRVRSYAPT
ncbi:SCF ubiquitin ligase complex subunit HRT3 KNAG_0G02120 [Huiozyma naganishii CBS 8797]|uniref:F-box protein Hrt3/FBXO9 C-terminal domain-containing protein n=1 Tax=Huiozyma naganishii (strain ATCC MYA-139 / BCRC 22969 / CBS 8797 / KCTC 17520 / NBRC 10181 / NCYC 3082 / Yp74L-3) TaxID=1071383 RepID=J7S800_HUIN7|nr:hypothetical protein KNAG_0G02120 [Kazachstania naganishii CBS 8797]CCK71269.1 hypothetical protein KNAG_0G02120 [Kazachstania naganishii CBS 8797]